VTIAQAAIHLQCSPRRIKHLIDKRQLPALRTGNGYYINVADLDRWLRPPRTATKLH
jgi:excisionase family DNA binding protein